MLSFFKRYRTQVPKPTPFTPYSYFTACELLRPMSQYDYEAANHSLENASDWLYKQQHGRPNSYLGHFDQRKMETGEYQESLSLSLSRHSVPVTLVNCSENLLTALPIVAPLQEELGIVHIGHSMGLKPTLDLKLGSAFHFILSRFQQVRLFYLGINEQITSRDTWEYAEDLGCDWLIDRELNFRHRHQLKRQMTNYLSHCQHIVLSIDLASLMATNGMDEREGLDLQSVLRAIKQCIASGRVRYIQLVGACDQHIFSKECQAILAALNDSTPMVHDVA